MRIACVSCPQGPFEINAEQEAAACPACERGYRVITRKITRSHSTSHAKGTYRYELHTAEPEGGERRRTLIAQGGLPLTPGSVVSLVYRGSRLVGIADQIHSSWYVVEVPPPRSAQLARFWSYMGWVALAVAALEAARFAGLLAQSERAALAGAVVVALILALLPVALRAARRWGGEPDAAYAELPSVPAPPQE